MIDKAWWRKWTLGNASWPLFSAVGSFDPHFVRIVCSPDLDRNALGQLHICQVVVVGGRSYVGSRAPLLGGPCSIDIWVVAISRNDQNAFLIIPYISVNDRCINTSTRACIWQRHFASICPNPGNLWATIELYAAFKIKNIGTCNW